MDINNFDISKYKVDQEMPFKNDFEYFWISAFDAKELEPIKSVHLKNNNDLRENIFSFFNEIDNSKCYRGFAEFCHFINTIAYNERKTIMLNHDILLVMSKYHNLSNYELAMESFKTKSIEKSKVFFEDLKKEFDLSDEELDFLIPNRFNALILMPFVFNQIIRDIQEYCSAR